MCTHMYPHVMQTHTHASTCTYTYQCKHVHTLTKQTHATIHTDKGRVCFVKQKNHETPSNVSSKPGDTNMKHGQRKLGREMGGRVACVHLIMSVQHHSKTHASPSSTACVYRRHPSAALVRQGLGLFLRLVIPRNAVQDRIPGIVSSPVAIVHMPEQHVRRFPGMIARSRSGAGQTQACTFAPPSKQTIFNIFFWQLKVKNSSSPRQCSHIPLKKSSRSKRKTGGPWGDTLSFFLRRRDRRECTVVLGSTAAGSRERSPHLRGCVRCVCQFMKFP